MLGWFTKDKNNPIKANIPSTDYSLYQQSKYKFFLEPDAPIISSECCKVMKKRPSHAYAKKTGRNPMTGEMASESRLRTQKWLENGCNGFDLKEPKSTPMAFWTEQDVLLYIKLHNLTICSVYGDIVTDYDAQGQLEGQVSLTEFAGDCGLFDIGNPPLKTTGCQRTGCVFCLYGIHLEKSPNRLEKMKITHPKLYDYVMRPESEGGLGYKEKIDWINEHGNMNIKY